LATIGMLPPTPASARRRDRPAVDWLIEADQPSIRFLTLTQLLHQSPSASEALRARRQIPTSGWVRDLLAEQKDRTYWVYPKSCYHPKDTGTVWILQLLAVLGMDGADPRIRNSCERFLGIHTMPDGGYACGIHSKRFSEECLTGRMTAVLLEFGYSTEDPRIWNAFEWLLENQLEDGGWNCRHGPKVHHSSIYSTYMALWAFSKIRSQQANASVRRAVRRGVEFMLAHRLFKSHTTNEIIRADWLRFSFPPNVGYDALQGLKLMIDLGVCRDKRLRDALDLVESKKLPDGRWALDTVPSPKNDKTGALTIELESKGQPSKWVTLNSLIVLSRTGRM